MAKGGGEFRLKNQLKIMFETNKADMFSIDETEICVFFTGRTFNNGFDIHQNKLNAYSLPLYT